MGSRRRIHGLPTADPWLPTADPWVSTVDPWVSTVDPWGPDGGSMAPDAPSTGSDAASTPGGAWGEGGDVQVGQAGGECGADGNALTNLTKPQNSASHPLHHSAPHPENVLVRIEIRDDTQHAFVVTLSHALTSRRSTAPAPHTGPAPACLREFFCAHDPGEPCRVSRVTCVDGGVTPVHVHVHG